jgi:hypothetical protein
MVLQSYYHMEIMACEEDSVKDSLLYPPAEIKPLSYEYNIISCIRVVHALLSSKLWEALCDVQLELTIYLVGLILSPTALCVVLT